MKTGMTLTVLTRFSWPRSLTLGIALLAIFFLVPVASAQCSGYSGPVTILGCSPGWGWSWYDPFPWGWGYPYVYPYEPYSGVVRIEHFAKDAAVYVDGAYAGTAGQLKKFRLLPGEHNIELRDSSGRTLRKETIHVLSSKTVKIRGSQ